MALYAHKFSGSVATGESFSFGFWATSSSTIQQLQTAAVQWVSDVWAGAGGTNGFGGMVTSGVSLDEVRTSLITESTGLQTALQETTVSHVGTATGNALPADVAITVSLRTDLANRSGRGRFYLPQPAASTLAADGRMTAGTVANLVSALQAAWQTYDSWGQPVVYSRKSRSTQTITSFNVGDLYDTQRRRENKLPEARTSGTV